jgi:hypothetical protein
VFEGGAGVGVGVTGLNMTRYETKIMAPKVNTII